MAEEIERNTYFSECVEHGRKIKTSVDEQIGLESRETMTDNVLDSDEHYEESEELEIFKKEHISLDLEKINNFGWHIKTDVERKVEQKKVRALQEKVQLRLRETQPMSEIEALSVKNIQSRNLTTEKRWALYLFWVQKKCTELYLDNEKKIDKFQAANEILKEVNMAEEKYILRDADIIGMTVTGAANHKTVLREVKPTIMIVEEAAEVFESHVISNLTPECQHLILIGDHKQLRPKPNMYKLEKVYNMDISLFERMIKNDFKYDCLEIQHRMRPQIADNVRHIYRTLTDHDSVKQYKSIRGISQNTFFINHCVEEKKNAELICYTNAHEVNYLVALCKYLLLQGYGASKITLLTPYKAQMSLLKKEMLKQGELLNDVKITTVDDYQGEENDIVLLSLVRSNKEGAVGFLAEDNRVCVAFSRAKEGFYVIGNFTIFESVSPLWNAIVNSMKNQGLIGNALTLCCQNHPNDEGIEAKNPTDFQLAPEGGCRKRCGVKLECGHACGKYCHVKNRNHKNITCKEICAKRCKNGHPCRKLCWEQCYCEEEIIETLQRCGHIVFCACSTDVEKVDCNETCMRVLDCGHKCREKCSDPCVCKEEVTVTLPKCGHQATIYCFVNPDRYKCDKYIEILRTNCGHSEKVRCRNRSEKTYCQSCENESDTEQGNHNTMFEVNIVTGDEHKNCETEDETIVKDKVYCDWNRDERGDNNNKNGELTTAEVTEVNCSASRKKNNCTKYIRDVDSNTKALDTTEEQLVQKKKYRENTSKKNKHLHSFKNEFEPPSKKQRYKETDMKTNSEVNHERGFDTSYKIPVKESYLFSPETDKRRVKFKNVQFKCNINVAYDEKGKNTTKNSFTCQPENLSVRKKKHLDQTDLRHVINAKREGLGKSNPMLDTDLSEFTF